jgi:ribonuclease HII
LAQASAPDRRTRRPLVHRGVEIVCSTRFEDAARAEGFLAVAGLDEVGRGALCGPVVAGAVVLGEGYDTTGLDDSKRLTALQRETQAERLRASALAIAIGSADHVEIDRLNILQATHLAMKRALAELTAALDLVLIDGRSQVPDLGVRQRAIVKGDARSVSIAAASIVAKVHRDALMKELDVRFPGYGLGHNMGYASDDHRDALRRLGPTEIHRRSFNGTQPWLF